VSDPLGSDPPGPNRLDEIVRDCVTGLGLDLEAVELTSGGKRRRLLVAVDTDGGVGIDVITQATRALSEALDTSDVMGPAQYTLEVTSRGIDRPLTAPRHWRRNEGRLVRVRLADETATNPVVEGRIGASDDTGVELVTKAAVRRHDYADIASAVIQAELNAQPGPQNSREDS
jgi:ribosome maturation factor RimP